MTGVSIFDLDRTITRRGTYLPFLIFAARRRAPWRLALLPLVALCMAAYALRLIPRARLKETMQRLMLGPHVARAEATELAETFADRIFAGGCHGEALDALARERAEGRLIAIATAAHRFYAQAIGARLGVDHLIATGSVWRDDVLTPAIDGPNLYGPAKRKAVLAFLSTLDDEEVTDLRFFSDSVSDLPTFDACTHPVVVNPDARLLVIAHARGWPILHWRAPGRGG